MISSLPITSSPHFSAFVNFPSRLENCKHLPVEEAGQRDGRGEGEEVKVGKP